MLRQNWNDVLQFPVKPPKCHGWQGSERRTSLQTRWQTSNTVLLVQDIYVFVRGCGYVLALLHWNTLEERLQHKHPHHTYSMCWMNPLFLYLRLFEQKVQSVDSSRSLIIDFSDLANWRSQSGLTLWSLPGTRSWLPAMTTGFTPEQVGHTESVSHASIHLQQLNNWLINWFC